MGRSNKSNKTNSQVPKSTSRVLAIFSNLRFRGIFVVLGIVLWFVERKNTIQSALDSEFESYVPGSSIYSFLLGLFMVSWLADKLAAKDLHERRDFVRFHGRIGNTRRIWIWVSFYTTIILTICVPKLLWEMHYKPAPVGNFIVVYVDSFDFQGWPKEELDLEVKRALLGALNRTIPSTAFQVRFIEPPKGIDGQNARIGWACKGGAIMTVYGQGSEFGIRPFVKLCSKAVPSPSVLNSDTIHPWTDVATASQVYRQFLRYSALPTDIALKLCVIEKLTPEYVKYLANFSLGLLCHYDELPGIDADQSTRLAPQFFEEALASVRSMSCEFDVCRLLYYKGRAEMELAQLSTEFKDSSLVQWTRADSSLSFAIQLNNSYYDARQALALTRLMRGKYHESDSILCQLIEEIRCIDSDSTRKVMALALFNRGSALGFLHENMKEIEVFAEFDSLSNEHPEVVQDWMVASALFNMGVSAEEVRDFELAQNCYSRIVDRFEHREGRELHLAVAHAKTNWSRVLSSLGKDNQEFEMYDRIVREYRDERDPLVLLQVPMAMVNRGSWYFRKGNYDDATVNCDSVISVFGDYPELGIQLVVAEALVRRGEANAKKGDTLGAIASFTEVSLRFGLLNDTRMVEKDVAARAKSAELYTRIGEGGKAIPVLRKIITSFLFTENESVLRQVLGAFQSLSVAYYKSGEYGLGVQLSDEIVDGLSERSDAESPLTITDAYLKKATFLCLLNEDESALIALNSVFQRVGDSPDAAQIGFRARAYLLASTAYRHLGRKSEAATALCKAYAIRDHLDKGEMDQLNAEFVVQGLNRQGCPEKYR